jgi:hypothetical protein
MDLTKKKTEDLRQLTWDLVFVLGAAVFVYGLSLAWRPLGFIVGGLIISALAFFIGYRRN